MIRVRFGIYNTEEEVDAFIESLPRAIEAAKKDQEEQNNAEDLIRMIDPTY